MASTCPVSLSAEAIDDLIYDARSGDLDAFKSDLENLSKQHNDCPSSDIIAAAIDPEPEDEGGSGACLLHYPAANGNSEILNFLLQALTSSTTLSESQIRAVVNHRNHSGNTPLHWAALNAHIDCVKALVNAGADISAKNAAGHDAVFLAERTAWSTQEDQEGGEQHVGETPNQTKEVNGSEQQDADGGEDAVAAAAAKELSSAEQVVKWLLGCDQAAGLESSVADGGTSSRS